MKPQARAWIRTIETGEGYADISTETFRRYLRDIENYRFFQVLKRYADRRHRVLEAGCGWALSSFALAERGIRTVALDVSGELIARLQRIQKDLGGKQRECLEPVCGDVFHLDRLGRRFDVVFSDGTYEHFTASEERKKILVNFRTVLADGGRLIVAVPNLGNPFFKWVVAHRMPAMHPFNTRALSQELEAGQFRILEQGYAFVNAGFRQWLKAPWMIGPVLGVNRFFGHMPRFAQATLAAHLYCVCEKKGE